MKPPVAAIFDEARNTICYIDGNKFCALSEDGDAFLGVPVNILK